MVLFHFLYLHKSDICQHIFLFKHDVLKIKIEESEILSIDMSGQPTRLQLLCFFMNVTGLNATILFTVVEGGQD